MSIHTGAAPWANTPPRGPRTAAVRARFTQDGGGPEQDWRKQAACVDEEPEQFYPASYTSAPALLAIEETKRICWGCPVRPECYAFAMASGDDHGILAGTTPDERKAARRRESRQRQRPERRRATAGRRADFRGSPLAA